MSAPSHSGGRLVALGHLTLLDVAPPQLALIAARAGYAGIGVRVAASGSSPQPHSMAAGSRMLRETVHRLDGLGLEVFDVSLVRLAPETQRDDYAPVLEAGAELGARYVNVPGDDPDETRASQTFAALVEDARPYGLRPLLEPMAYRRISRVETAARIAGRSPGGGVLIDCLHVHRCGATADTLRSLPADLVHLVQVSDAPNEQPHGLTPPRSLPTGLEAVTDAELESLAMRHLPGDGELPLAELLRAVPADRPVSVEAPSMMLRDCLTPEEMARRAYQRTVQLLSRL